MNYNYGYSNDRLNKLAMNILIGMDLVDKRVDSLRGRKVKKELNEEEQRLAMKETNDFFENKETQRRLEKLKKLIVDNTANDKFNEIYRNVDTTPQSYINAMNLKVPFNPYEIKEG